MPDARSAQDASRASWTRMAVAELAARGLLLRADGRLPSVTRLVAGGPIRGSWWSHPKAHDIYAVSEALNHHPDATVAKLLVGKVTYVHRALWPALASVGGAREPWQMDGLPPAAVSLLELVTSSGGVRTDQLTDRRFADPRKVKAAVASLERRLLVHAEDVHTERGAHARRLAPWPEWAALRKVPAPLPPPARARARLEERAIALAPGSVRPLLPWL